MAEEQIESVLQQEGQIKNPNGFQLEPVWVLDLENRWSGSIVGTQ